MHGAWHNDVAFAPLQQALSTHGIATHTVNLTSVAGPNEPLGDLASDAALVRDVVNTLGPDVAVLGHSYGGLPITQGLAGATNVSHLLYLTAFMLDEGETLYGACGAVDPPWWVRSGDDERVTPRDPESVFYNTCDPAVAASTAATLRTQSLKSFNDPLTDVAWRTIPSTYIVCEQDNAIPIFAQEAMAQRAGSVRRLDTDHSPFLCAPEELAVMIAEILNS